MHFRIRSFSFSFLASVAILSGCATNAVTGRQQFNMVSEQAAISNGKAGYSKIIEKYEKDGKLVKEGQTVERVTLIANRLIDQAVKIYPSSSDWAWDIQVLDDSSPNAWCLPGGKMAIHTGIIDNLSLTDDEIAAIVGHEIAHALVGHGAERQSIQMASGLATALLAVALGQTNQEREAIYSVTSVASALAITLPYSRDHESEADRVGIEIAARAGFDPAAAVSLWKKMGKHSGSTGGTDFFSTHPSSQKRQEELARLEPSMRPLMRDAIAQRIDLNAPNPWVSNSSNSYASFSRSTYLASISPLQLITHVNNFEKERLGASNTEVAVTTEPQPSVLQVVSNEKQAVKESASGVVDALVISSAPAPSALNAGEPPGSASSTKPLPAPAKSLKEIQLTCESNCPEMTTSNSAKLRYAIEQRNWALVYNTIQTMNAKADSAYYWLGKAALELGDSRLAISYFNTAQSLSKQQRFSCDHQGALPCFGANIQAQTTDALSLITKK